MFCTYKRIGCGFYSIKNKLFIYLIHLSNGVYFVVLGGNKRVSVEQLYIYGNHIGLSYFNWMLQSSYINFNVYG